MADCTKNTEIMIFDRDLIKRNRARAQQNFSDHNFLFKWSQVQLADRLDDINRTFDRALQIGARVPFNLNHPKIKQLSLMDISAQPMSPSSLPYIQASEEFLPIASKSLNLVISSLNLHSVNDLPGSLIQIKQSLKNDGLFLATLFGGETLNELRHVMTESEIKFFGGASPHIFPFADKLQMGHLLQRAGFALPVIDSEIITVSYGNVFKLFQDLRGMGEGNAINARHKTPLHKTFFMDVAKRYHAQFPEQDGRIKASFEVIFLLGWAPDHTQQKPLRPGSAKHSLAEALSATEIKTEESVKP